MVNSNRALKPPSDSRFVWIRQQSNFVVVIDRIRTLEQIGSDDLLSSAWSVAGFDHKLRFLASVQQKCQWFCIRASIGIVNNWDGEKHDKKIQDVGGFWRLDAPRSNDPVLLGLKGLPQQEQQVPKQGVALAVKDPLQHLQAREVHKGIYCRINYRHFAWGLLLQWGVEGEERTINAAYWGGPCQTTYWADHPYVLYFPIAASQQSSQTPFLPCFHNVPSPISEGKTWMVQMGYKLNRTKKKTHMVTCPVPKHGSGSIKCLCCLIDTTLRRRHLSMVDKVLVGSSLVGLQLLQSLPDKGG